MGAGFFGATCARQLSDAGLKVLVLEKKTRVGGHAATETRHGIITHLYGPHLWHCSDPKLWKFITRFGQFNHYQHRVKALNEVIYSLPFNMQTFHQLWGCVYPEEAQQELEKRRVKINNPQNCEEQALAMVGGEAYEKLIYGYTLKHWQKHPRDLPASIIKRLPIRFTYDDNYFDDPYQGVPVDGYTCLIENMLDGIEVRLDEDFFWLSNWRNVAKKLIYTGPIDRFFDYKYGELEYIGLDFEHIHTKGNKLGIGQLNFPGLDVPHTRAIEHKHFQFKADLPDTIVSYERSIVWDHTQECYYPINTTENAAIYQKYRQKFDKISSIYGGGRNFEYKYLDMDNTVQSALQLSRRLTK